MMRMRLVLLVCVGSMWGCGGGSAPGDGSVDDEDVGSLDASSEDGGAPGECPDEDIDGVCDEDDVCPLGADSIDSDADGVPDACDVCPGGDDGQDSDDDTVPDTCDMCADGDDLLDLDQDGVPNACDTCARGADVIDGDSDGVPDACDVCLAGDDGADADADGFPDACDACAEGDDRVDLDFDGVPDACDVCPVGDNALDEDSDGVPDACDACQGFDDGVDVDGDGVPDGCDACLDDPDGPDADGDGVPDGCDICPGLDDASQGIRGGDFSDPTQWTPPSLAANQSMELLKDEFSSATEYRQALCTPATEVTPRLLDMLFAHGCSPGSQCEALNRVNLDGVTHIDSPASFGTGGFTRRFCMGESYYGGSEFSISAAELNYRPDHLTLLEIKDREAPEVCPRVGEFGNGSFTQDLDMWFGRENVSIVDNAGDKAMRIQGAAPNACGAATVQGRFSVPSALLNGAIRFRWRGGVLGNSLWWLGVYGEETTRRDIRDTESVSWRDETICLPSNSSGASLVFYMNMASAGSVSCASPVTRDVEVDDFVLVSDPVACP